MNLLNPYSILTQHFKFSNFLYIDNNQRCEQKRKKSTHANIEQFFNNPLTSQNSSAIDLSLSGEISNLVNIVTNE